MHLSSCEHPRLIINPYNGQRIAVRCGHCNTCRNIKASLWTQRLEDEMSLHKYNAFFTLTYSPECLPVAQYYKGYLMVEPQRFKIGRYTIKRDGMFEPLGFDLRRKDVEDIEVLTKVYHGIPYAPSCDIQRFFKRLRINLNRKYGIDKTERIRYYAIREFGETTYRPHWHILCFYDSEALHKVLCPAIYASWPFSHRDIFFSLVTGKAASYVASYLGCDTSLPKVLTSSPIRPKAFMSKCPFIGHDFIPSEKIREIFYTSTPTVMRQEPATQSVEYVPLSRSFKNRYFPKCFGYGDLSCYDRTWLYSVYGFFKSYDAFESYCRECVEEGFTDPITTKVLSRIYDKELYGLYRQIWQTSRVAYRNLAFFGCKSMREYVEYLDEFWKRDDYNNLVSWYRAFEEGCADGTFQPDDYLTFYPVWLEQQSRKHDAPFFKKLEETYDYRSMVEMHKVISHNNKTTKRKNDYLDAHPEYKVFNLIC